MAAKVTKKTCSKCGSQLPGTRKSKVCERCVAKPWREMSMDRFFESNEGEVFEQFMDLYKTRKSDGWSLVCTHVADECTEMVCIWEKVTHEQPRTPRA